MADNKLDIKAFLDKDEQKDLLRLLTAPVRLMMGNQR